MEHESQILPKNLPNIVRERETRHISAIESAGNESVLSVEDFFGHEQYGIPTGRKLSQDYHAGAGFWSATDREAAKALWYA